MQEGILQKTGKEKFSKPRGLISGRDTSAIGYSGKFLRHSLANKPGFQYSPPPGKIWERIASLVTQIVNSLPAMWETWVQSFGS